MPQELPIPDHCSTQSSHIHPTYVCVRVGHHVSALGGCHHRGTRRPRRSHACTSTLRLCMETQTPTPSFQAHGTLTCPPSFHSKVAKARPFPRFVIPLSGIQSAKAPKPGLSKRRGGGKSTLRLAWSVTGCENNSLMMLDFAPGMICSYRRELPHVKKQSAVHRRNEGVPVWATGGVTRTASVPCDVVVEKSTSCLCIPRGSRWHA